MQERFEKAIQALKPGPMPTYDWEKLQPEVELIYSGKPSEKVYDQGYWFQEGVYQNIKSFLIEHVIPEKGKSKIRSLDLLMDLNGIYHDVYNNGWCNRRGFNYTDYVKAKNPDPKAIHKIRFNIDEYESLNSRQEKYRGALDDALVNLQETEYELRELVYPKRQKKDYEDYGDEEDERPYVSGIPFSLHDLEYALNAAIRLCLGCEEESDDAKLYPNIKLDDSFLNNDSDEDDDSSSEEPEIVDNDAATEENDEEKENTCIPC